ncbi:hypothetical protein [Acetonema longum]|uniref:Methyl-accepting chemotaxis protein n=1 Tax=Acetonema longum DSM 6540 TaxID=1009370 RepID=F7NK63_9FIRM|nr:hypothetical protein [Acetonema longum]EGO63504.1 hypothetical protein ALO_12381 [Acetonema longum DSM 6540]
MNGMKYGVGITGAFAGGYDGNDCAAQQVQRKQGQVEKSLNEISDIADTTLRLAREILDAVSLPKPQQACNGAGVPESFDTVAGRLQTTGSVLIEANNRLHEILEILQDQLGDQKLV